MTTKEAVGNEVWAPVAGWEGLYSVSTQGRVRRDCAGSSTYAGRILKSHLQHGYPIVGLRGGSKRPRASCYVHRLVAEAFLGPCPEGKEVNHKDLDRTNSTPPNLEYVTRSENLKHSYSIRGPRCGERASYTKLKWVDVIEIRALHGKETIVSLGKRFGVSHDTISAVQRGKTWKVPR